MSWEQAYAYAQGLSRLCGCRYRVRGVRVFGIWTYRVYRGVPR